MKVRSATVFLLYKITPIPLCAQRSASLSTTTMASTPNNMIKQKIISVKSAGFQEVNGIYRPQSPSTIPAGFDRTCRAMNWNTEQMWNQLAQSNLQWFEADNKSYIYWNKGDGKWWIDGPSGAGVYIVKNDAILPPKSGWISLSEDYDPTPTVEVLDRAV